MNERTNERVGVKAEAHKSWSLGHPDHPSLYSHERHYLEDDLGLDSSSTLTSCWLSESCLISFICNLLCLCMSVV